MNKSQVEAIMSPNVIKVNASESLASVIHIFEAAHISGSPVVNDAGEIVGIISKTDLASGKLIKLLESGRDFRTITVKDVMNTTEPICIHRNGSLFEVLALMQKRKIHRVFVSDDNNEISGVISTLDIVKMIRKKESVKQPAIVN